LAIKLTSKVSDHRTLLLSLEMCKLPNL